LRSLRCDGGGRVTVVELPDPQPGEGEALIRIEASAVCGSERSIFASGVEALDGRVNGGHEACGIVIEPGASPFSPGDRVGLSAVHGCGECERCVRGEEVHCRRGMTYTASAGWHAELATIPGASLFPLPAGTTAAGGAMLSGDTIGVAGRAYRRDPTGPGDQVVVFGLGPVGLGHVAIRAFTGAEVIAVEPSAYRRELALSLGAKAAVAPGEPIDARPRVVAECTGRPDCIALALELVDDGGTVHQSGLCHEPISIDPMVFYRREIVYTGDMYYAREDYPAMMELVERGLPLERLCTHEVPAADSQPAITEFLAARTGKVILRWDL
jgi:threonine dehydrogenase-like Zn-dependent dehydrogenase